MTTASQFTGAVTAPKVGLRDYAMVGIVLALFGVGFYVCTRANASAIRSDQLLAPLSGLLGLIALVWLMMVWFPRIHVRGA